MTELVFYFDPACPWAWRTSLWIREVREVRPLDVEWKVFSLADINRRGDEPMLRASLRAIVLARRTGGNEAVDRLYRAVGGAQHEHHHSIRKESVVEDALEEAGFERSLLRQALDDPSTLDELLSEHNEAVERFNAFGVPWLVPAGQDFGFYGPVITDVPRGEAAGELWDHTSWLLRQPNFYEIKRERG